MKKALYAKKIGMTQICDENGIIHSVTVLEGLKSKVITRKTQEVDGYNCLVIGFGEIKQSKLNKPMEGFFKKHNTDPTKFIKELRFDDSDSVNDIDQLTLDQFSEGDLITCTGKTIGKGFQGTIKVHGFARGPMSHGSKNHRLPGSIGAGTDPARVFKGTKMGKKLGNKQRTIKSLKVIKLDPENNFIFLKGSVPGKKKSIVLLHN